MSRSLAAAFTLVLCLVPSFAADDPAHPLAGVESVRVRVAPHAFRPGPSPFSEREPGATTLDEAYEKRIAEALVGSGIVVDPEAPVTIETWVYSDGEAVVRVRSMGDSQVSWSGVVVHDGDGTGVALLEGLAAATVRAVTGEEPPEACAVLTVDALVAELDRSDPERAGRAVSRLTRLQDPEDLAVVRRWAEENRIDFGESLDVDHRANGGPDVRVRWHWNRALAALQRGEPTPAADHLRATIELQPDHRSAHGILGDLLIRGDGVAPDVEAGLTHLGKAATLGSADAAYQLGYVHARGEQVPRDLVEAYAWFERGARRGHEASIAGRDALAATLTAEQIADAESRIAPDEASAPSDEPMLAGIHGVTNPVPIRTTLFQPEYPLQARAARLTGNVILQAVIRRDGTVGEIKVLRVDKPNLGFEQAAVEAVRKWRYQPATLHGDPVDVYFTINVDFTLH
jgi:TonB family protein